MKIQKRCALLVFFLVFVTTVVVKAEEDSTTNGASSEDTTTASAGASSSTNGEEGSGSSEQQQPEEKTSTAQQKATKKKRPLNEKVDWGTYYDPKNIFCGDYDCYKILGFDFEEFNAKAKRGDKISKAEITKTYRKLSREWHPDKNKHNPKAKERFVKIARAYEVLTNENTRKEYDFLRYNQEAYVSKYGSSVLWQYKPKSDTIFVIIFLLVCSTAVAWYAQLGKWQNIANKLINAAADDVGPMEGGTDEAKNLRQRAIEKLEEQGWVSVDKPAGSSNDNNGGKGSGSSKGSPTKKSKNNSTSSSSSPAKASKKKGGKLTAKEKKEEYNEQLRPIIREIVENEMVDFGCGYHKPVFPKDLLIYQMVVCWPKDIAHGIIWNANYFLRRLLKKELSDDEKTVLTIRAVGNTQWQTQTEEEQKRMLTLELWKSPDALQKWSEEQEFSRLPAGMQKRIKKMMKYEKQRGGGSSMSDIAGMMKEHDE